MKVHIWILIDEEERSVIGHTGFNAEDLEVKIEPLPEKEGGISVSFFRPEGSKLIFPDNLINFKRFDRTSNPGYAIIEFDAEIKDEPEPDDTGDLP